MDYVLSIAYSPDGSHIISGSIDKTIRLWDGKTGEEVSKSFVGQIDNVQSGASSPGRHHIASASEHITIQHQDVTSGQPSNDGWLQTAKQKSHVLWVPHAFHQHLFNYHPWPIILSAQPQIKIDFTNAALGPKWKMIYD
jgi:WD40 repeat protein